jgi:1,4-dihydroxy-2-naphthoate octaprenyltransferase
MPISYLPIGELVSGFVMGGLIPLGIAACTSGGLHGQILGYALPLVVGIGLIMMSNNGSDAEKDQKNGRHTLPIFLGRTWTLRFYRCLIVVWILLVAILPVIAEGAVGLSGIALAAIFGGRIIRSQLTATLQPEQRISTMRGIIRTNLVLNGAYTAAFAIGCILEVVHG